MKSIWNKLKEKWNIESDRRLAWIFVVFAITGSSIGFVRRPITQFLFQKSKYGELNWYELIITIVIVYFVYQILLFTIGTLLGEYKFVKWFVLKMNKRMFPFLKSK
ncbi:diacylglyceryl transferase [Bacteroidia bacterium]|nr:diacylglyceryl transferase [Bacteroidia bacterium]MDB9883202.1 diacylglyceryl transferase [Bacteroidia bacterium]